MGSSRYVIEAHHVHATSHCDVALHSLQVFDILHYVIVSSELSATKNAARWLIENTEHSKLYHRKAERDEL